MNPDSLIIIKAVVPDTLRIVNISPPTSMPGEVYVILGVIIGGFLSFLSGILLAKYQSRVQIRTSFFTRRLEVYVKLAELTWQGYHVLVKAGPGENTGAFPKAFQTLVGLRDWNNAMAEYVDQNRFLLDQGTYKAFEGLNHKVLGHLEGIERHPYTGEQQNILCRNEGRNCVAEIQRLSEAFVDAARIYINRQYSVDLEKVI